MLVYLSIYIAAILEGEIYYSKVCADAISGRLFWPAVNKNKTNWDSTSQQPRPVAHRNEAFAFDPSLPTGLPPPQGCCLLPLLDHGGQPGILLLPLLKHGQERGCLLLVGSGEIPTEHLLL